MSLIKLSNISRLLKLGLVANLLEWYEYSLAGSLAVIMGEVFFHEADPIFRLTKAWLIFSLSYLARPIGSFFWGYIGDRYGHAYSLKQSLLMMGIPTILIGILPTYHHVGIAATIALILLRFMQGFAAGGELPISACYLFENSPPRFRSLLCSSVSAGVGLGIMSGSIIVRLLYQIFTSEQILANAWRIPYLLSIPLLFWILRIRKSIENNAKAVQENYSSFSIDTFLKTSLHTLRLLIQTGLFPLMLLVGFMEVSCYVLLFWLPSYLQVFLHISPTTAQTGNVFLLATLQVFILMMGYLAGHIGYKRILLIHTTLIIAFSYPLFQGLQTQSFYLLMGIHILFAWLYSGLAAVMMEALGNAYPREIRSSGMSITHTIGATLFGGITPTISTWAIQKTGLLLFPAYYMILMGLVAFFIILRLKVPIQALTESSEGKSTHQNENTETL